MRIGLRIWCLSDHHKSMQTFINEKFYSYEKVFTRGISAAALDIARTVNVADDDAARDRSLLTKFILPLDSTEELVLWNTEIKDENYHKFMVRPDILLYSKFLCNYHYFVFHLRQNSWVSTSANMVITRMQTKRPCNVFPVCYQWTWWPNCPGLLFSGKKNQKNLIKARFIIYFYS